MSEISTGDALAPEVRDLLEQRATLQQWISGLEAQRGTTSERILQRVREDYEGRLTEVNDALSDHVSGIQAEMDRSVERSADATKVHEAAVDALEEARLRHAIGELPGKGWTDRERHLMEEVETAKVAEDAARSEADRLSELLGSLTRSGDPVAGVAGVVADEDTTSGPVDSDDADDSPVPVEGGTDPIGATIDEVEEEPAEVSADDDVDSEVDAESSEIEAEGDETDAGVESGRATQNPDSDTSPAADDEGQGRMFAESVQVELQAESPPNEAPGLFDADDVPSTEQAPPPGLKCAECGYTNDLSAWFCGVCGADVG